VPVATPASSKFLSADCVSRMPPSPVEGGLTPVAVTTGVFVGVGVGVLVGVFVTTGVGVGPVESITGICTAMMMGGRRPFPTARRPECTRVAPRTP
jgi:hypothetical protein